MTGKEREREGSRGEGRGCQLIPCRSRFNGNGWQKLREGGRSPETEEALWESVCVCVCYVTHPVGYVTHPLRFQVNVSEKNLSLWKEHGQGKWVC